MVFFLKNPTDKKTKQDIASSFFLPFSLSPLEYFSFIPTLYKNPEILILDEATSSLDTDSEQVIQATLNELKRTGKTLIVIAHRLSTIAHSDTILVLKNGRLIEQGTHQELLARETTYKGMWEKQSLF